MESGLFGRASLRNLEFDSESGLRAIPLPDELPAPPNLSSLPKDILKSTTVENLLSQNEDLMARLKVSLRRLSQLEQDNQTLSAEAEEARRRKSNAEDLALVLREKDQAWKAKTEEVTRHKDVLEEKYRIMNERLHQSETDVARHLRYQDRIRTQVKPQMTQLKEYARGLETRLAGVDGEVARRDSQLSELRQQMMEVVRHSRTQVEMSEQKASQMIDGYETSLASAQEQLAAARLTVQDLEMKAARLRRVEQRCDELENETVELRRSKEDLTHRGEAEAQRLANRLEEFTRENAKMKIENEDLRGKALSDTERVRGLERQTLDLQSQLESLRYLWNARNEENDRLKMSLSALEKINVDLSAKLQDLKER